MTTAARRPGRFGAVVTAMATPFDAEGRLDIDGAVKLARHLAEDGSDGLVVTGTTGEGPTLTDSERTELWAAVASAVSVPVIAGSTSNDTAHSVELTRAATAHGRGRDPRRHPLLQPPLAVAASPPISPPSPPPRTLPGHRLRHPGAHGAQGRPRDDARSSCASARTSSG